MSTLQPLIFAPEKAGRARLEFGTQTGLHASYVGRPDNEPDSIHFEASFEDIDFYPLMGGDQFLARVPMWSSHAVYFGGTDESPFLVELKPGIFRSFELYGEDCFYEALKPDLIRAFERNYGS